MSTATIANQRRAGRMRLTGICLLTAAVWLIGLPRLAEFPPVARWLKRLDEHKVDPSAMYYTEVEALKPTLERLNAPRHAKTERALSVGSDD